MADDQSGLHDTPSDAGQRYSYRLSIGGDPLDIRIPHLGQESVWPFTKEGSISIISEGTDVEIESDAAAAKGHLCRGDRQAPSPKLGIVTESNNISNNIPALARPGTAGTVLLPQGETDCSLCISQFIIISSVSYTD